MVEIIIKSITKIINDEFIDKIIGRIRRNLNMFCY